MTQNVEALGKIVEMNWMTEPDAIVAVSSFSLAAIMILFLTGNYTALPVVSLMGLVGLFGIVLH